MSAIRGSRSGVANDMIMLDDVSESSILEALAKHHASDEIYTYIGETLISVNPYKNISSLYGQSIMKRYVSKKAFQNPPHPYAVAERAFRDMQLHSANQTIVITGESGSGKTEASKFCMNYISFLASKTSNVQRIKEQLLETNPLLEAFGNAKTRRNDNSSRFGKYMELQFLGSDPAGGHISQYLLEKARVVGQQEGERNFHIFYQILSDSSLCGQLNLSRDPGAYTYISDAQSAIVRGMSDSSNWSETLKAMGWCGIKGEDQSAAIGAVGAILHLGNVKFKSAGRDKSHIANKPTLALAADLLGIREKDLGIALTHRTVKSGIESVRTGLSVENAKFARDSLAKSLYGKVFEWIVKRANETIKCERWSTTIGVLDIYGFEILGVNGFEQLCINHTNERLHQLFIELTLRQEQKEYRDEGISWQEIKFFDNLPICTMIERRGGIYSLVDEESIFPTGSDESLAKKLISNIRDKNFKNSRNGANQFVITHYAGEVQYDTTGFLTSNRDTLFPDLVLVCNSSRNPVVQTFFVDHPAANKSLKTNKRPPTTAQQYKKQVFDLMETLKGANQHYIRCIKPNGEKRGGSFDKELCSEQVRYLGLLENVKVRRAGFAYRLDYDDFVGTFKVAASFTEWIPDARKGTERILRSANAKAFELGKSKVFIKNANTILSIEDARMKFLELAASFLPPTDNLIFADKVFGFNSKGIRQELYLCVAGTGFYWYDPSGSLEHYIRMEKMDHILYNDLEGYMVSQSNYPSRIENETIQLNYLSTNVYASAVVRLCELLEGGLGIKLETSKTSYIPADAQDPKLYRENLKNIAKGALELPESNKRNLSSKGCCVLS